MSMMGIPLAQFRPIKAYKPRVGDFVIWHGWISHYYGIIVRIDKDDVYITRAGLPQLLLTMTPDEVNDDRNIVMVNIHKLRRSRAQYAIQQNGVWYIG